MTFKAQLLSISRHRSPPTVGGNQLGTKQSRQSPPKHVQYNQVHYTEYLQATLIENLYGLKKDT